ncbi:MAG: phosphatidylglycerophosphatase A [Ignavibacteria bacterium]|nr:phosphatidylglycerophosphatase A [Ignavibacteria bacterium]
MNSTSNTFVQQSQSKQGHIPLFTRVVATGLFAGYSPIAPGTTGSVVGLALYALLGTDNLLIFSIAIVVTFFLGTVVSSQMERLLGEDPPVVVIDEIVGMWISLWLLPKTIWLALGAFFIFRIYDIIKPQPARTFESIKNGWGIMLDDVVAGVYANLTMRLLLVLFPGLL